MANATLGVIMGNRDFFPDQLLVECRAQITKLFAELGIDAVILGPDEAKLGGVETYAHAQACARLFKANRERIDGILVTLPNFGDEKGVADTLKLAGLNVPVLVHGWPDDLNKLAVETRRDAFCGKISVCNNLKQYGIPFSLPRKHVVRPEDAGFKQDLRSFVATCRVVKGLRSARLGAIGARPGNFNTVRYSEKLLQDAGVSVVTVDLSEILGAATRLSDSDPKVRGKLDQIRGYGDSSAVPQLPLIKMAKLGIAIDEWMQAYDLHATAIQCWTSIQQNYGINSCTLMSMMSQKLLPSACEVDITGVLSMYALQLASGKPSALVDWNNNYPGDDNKCVLFHCGNWAKSFLPDLKIAQAEILGTTLGVENTYGAVAGRVPAGPLTFARVTTDDVAGRIRTYVGEGTLTDDSLPTFGAKAVVAIPRLQKLMRHICRNGYEHHCGVNQSHTAGILHEAFGTYLGWDVYHHEQADDE